MPRSSITQVVKKDLSGFRIQNVDFVLVGTSVIPA